MSSNWHHKRPRSRGGSDRNENRVLVDAQRHYHWHALFGNMSGAEIARETNTLWLDPAYKVVKK